MDKFKIYTFLDIFGFDWIFYCLTYIYSFYRHIIPLTVYIIHVIAYYVECNFKMLQIISEL